MKTNKQEKQRKKWRTERRNWVLNNPEKAKELNRKHRDVYRSIKKNRIKRNARRKIEYEVFMGRLKKRKHCQQRGCRKKKVEAHHDDYKKPLDIKWLCKLHHWARHRKLCA